MNGKVLTVKDDDVISYFQHYKNDFGRNTHYVSKIILCECYLFEDGDNRIPQEHAKKRAPCFS